MAVKQVQVFSLPTEYERQAAEARRREMMAQMLAQQEYDPGQYAGAPIPKAAPVVKALEGYLKGREMRKAREASEKATAADMAEVSALQKLNTPQTRSITGGTIPETDAFGTASAYQPEMAQQPMMETTMAPLAERQAAIDKAFVSGSPQARRYAELLMSRMKEPETKTMEFGGQLVNVADGKATPVVDVSGKPLSKPAESKAVTKSTDFGGFIREYYNDGSYQDVKKTLAPSGPRDEPLMLVDVNGVPTYVPRSKAVNKTAYVNKPTSGLTGDDKVDRRQFRTKRAELQNAYNSVLSFAQELKNTPKEESLVGEKAGSLSSKYKLALGAVRVLQNTGVLNPGELPFIEDTLRDPQSFTQLFNPASRQTIGGQIDSILDLLEQQSQVNDEAYGYDINPLKGRQLRGEKIPDAAVKAGLTQADWDSATEEEKAAWR